MRPRLFSFSYGLLFACFKAIVMAEILNKTIAKNGFVVLDGGLGTELERRGVNISALV